MKKRLSTLVVLFLLVTFQSRSQGIKVDCIYMSSGEVYRGMIIRKTFDTLTIQTLAGNRIMVAADAIDSVGKDSRRRLVREYKSYMVKERGWFNLVEVNTRLNWLDEIGVGASIYRGYKFNRNVSLAAGAGFLYKAVNFIQYYNHYRLALQMRIDMNSKGDYPFLLVESGLQRIFGDPRILRLPYYQAGLGYCITKRSGKSWLISAGVTQSIRRDKTYPLNPQTPGPIYLDWYHVYEPFVKVALRF